MSKIDATTYVTLPVGTNIELYTDTRPSMGQTFNVRHIDTKKVVHKAKVTQVEFYSGKQLKYRVIARIIS